MDHGTGPARQIGSWTTRDTATADREAREQYVTTYRERHGVELVAS